MQLKYTSIIKRKCASNVQLDDICEGILNYYLFLNFDEMETRIIWVPFICLEDQLPEEEEQAQQ